MPVARKMDWTVEMARTLPDDGNRYEVVDGELLVSPSPSQRHQLAVELLHLHLATYVRTTRRLHVHVAPCEIAFSTRRGVQPDLFAMRLRDGKMPPDESLREHVLLAVEVLSPSTARYDRVVKRPMYQSEHVEYWILDVDARVVERWTPDENRPEVVTRLLTWQPLTDQPSFELDVEEYFREVWEET